MYKDLTIYQASAGSGKTFRLALEYIKLLILNPDSYRATLAVTFTNKATEEMKTRILSMLYAIANDTPEGKAYALTAIAEMGISKDELHKHAAMALHYLVHNYDYFHIETIDSFFQCVLRNLAKELDLGAALRIELDANRIESEAIDKMIEELDEKQPLFNWLIGNIIEKIDKGENWNVVKETKEFGRLIFEDEYQSLAHIFDIIFTEKDFFKHYKFEILNFRHETEQCLKERISLFKNILQSEGIDTFDFCGGKAKGINGYLKGLLSTGLEKLNYQEKNVYDLLNEPSKWFKSKSPTAQRIASITKDVLIPFLRETEALRRQAFVNFCSANVTLRNLANLRLLGQIESKIKELNADDNRFLLTDTQHVLSGMIDNTDSPFIFEKIGVQLRHIMIDEFQDTSLVQWQNFSLLLHECMSSRAYGKGVISNLIVGDIKQSIYRWRGGDWNLLAGLNKQFPNYAVDIKTLKDNYRSERNIVTFNNAFFSIAAKLEMGFEQQVNPSEAHLLTEAYADVEQRPMKKSDKGLVKIVLANSNNWRQKMLEETESTLRKLIGCGTPPNSIAILLRTNKQIDDVASYLHTNCPEIKVVSDEAFRLEYAISTRCIILALKILYIPSDRHSLGMLAKICIELTGKGNSDYLLSMVSDLSELLPYEFIQQSEKLKRLPLYDLCETLFSIFGLDRLNQESAFICAFFDSLTEYINDMTASPLGFIHEWEETICHKTIQTDSIDGVRLLTINKSKGLEFDNVILPYCNWQLEKYSGNTIWCHPTEKPFSKLPALPINYSPKLNDTIYAKDYRHEHTQNTIDNMNLLYVAFTRPKKNLFVIGQRPGSKKMSNNRSQLLASVLPKLIESSTLEGATLEGASLTEEDLIFKFGTFESTKIKVQEDTSNVFLKPYTPAKVNIISKRAPFDYLIPRNDKLKSTKEISFKQSNISKKFIEDISEEKSAGEKCHSLHGIPNYIKEGNIMHIILSEIRTSKDIPLVLERFDNNGILNEANLDKKAIEYTINQTLSSSAIVVDWFSPRWTIFNECSILCEKVPGEVTTLRPDRVMKDGNHIVVVDFKFGHSELPQYYEQVRTYINILKEMGFSDVTGYLWFINLGKIIEIEQ